MHNPSGRPSRCAARSHSARLVAYGESTNSRGAPLCTMTNAASFGIATWCISSVWKSICSACPSSAPAIASGSSSPTWAPALRSASWHVVASAIGSSWCPSASSSATENAALDDSPAPTGSVLVTLIDPPAPGCCSLRSAAASRPCSGSGIPAAAAAAPQLQPPSTAISTGWSGYWSESIPMRKLSGFGV